VVLVCPDRLVASYHSGCTRARKTEIEHDLQERDGHFRLVVVSAALGRGANFPAIHRVIFLKAPLSLEDLWQVAGRAGRQDPGLALITVWWLPLDVPKDKAAQSLRKWLQLQAGVDRTTCCRRAQALAYFAFEGDPPPTLPMEHTCCDLCRPRCACSTCPPLPVYEVPLPIGTPTYSSHC